MKLNHWLLLGSIVTFTTLPAFSADIQFSDKDKRQVETIVHEYLVRKPEVLVEAFQVLQQKQFQEAEKTIKKTQQEATSFAQSLFHQTADPVGGNAKGTITLVEFFDYQCPHCADMVPIIDAAVKANPELRIVYKDFPIRGPNSELAGRAALAAHKQNKYQAFNHAVFKSFKENGPLTQEKIIQIAKDVGLNVKQFKDDLDQANFKSQLEANVKLAQRLKLLGTPALFIGKTDHTKEIAYLPGIANPKQLQDMIDKFK